MKAEAVVPTPAYIVISALCRWGNVPGLLDILMDEKTVAGRLFDVVRKQASLTVVQEVIARRPVQTLLKNLRQR